MEKGFVHYGADVSMTETPMEAGSAVANICLYDTHSESINAFIH